MSAIERTMSETAVDFSEYLVDNLQVGVVITGADSRIVRYVNAMACEILGREPETMLGRSWRFLVPQSDFELFTVYERGIVRRDRPGASSGRFRPFRVRFARPGGEIVHALVSSTITREFMEEFGDDEPHLVHRLEDVTDQDSIGNYLGLVLDNSPVSIGLLDRSRRVVYASGGRSPEETADLLDAQTTPITEVMAEYPESLSMLDPAFSGAAASKVIRGYGRYFDFHVVPISDASGQVRLVGTVSTDVTERERARAGQARLAALAEQALVTLEPVDLWRRATTVLADHLDAAATLHELDPAEPARQLTLAAAVGPPLPDAVAGGVLSAVIQTGRATVQDAETPGGWRILAAPVGRPGSCTAVVAVHRRGAEAGPFTARDEEFLGAVASVLGSAAVRFAAERELRYHSTHDALTDLPNRAWLLDRLAHTLQHHRTGMIFIDLDGFKSINDTHGHRAGDQLLREVARRLRTAVRPGDLVARLAGDEFVVLCERVDSPAAIERLAQRLLATIEEPVVLAEATVRVSASAGVAISDADLLDPDRLLNASDIAMYTAKRTGAGRCVAHQSWMHL
jgi:diguanylate cyclase (GGDEF)-like protein/PAS domain S-box-containing protein